MLVFVVWLSYEGISLVLLKKKIKKMNVEEGFCGGH